MKKKASKSSDYLELLTTDRLGDIWEKIRSDTEGRRALERLDEAGFESRILTPSDATFKRPCWADYVAALPLLPNIPSTRRIYSKIKLRKYWPLVRELRRFAATANSPFSEVTIGRKDDPDSSLSIGLSLESKKWNSRLFVCNGRHNSVQSSTAPLFWQLLKVLID